jgi:hypothetical protein
LPHQAVFFLPKTQKKTGLVRHVRFSFKKKNEIELRKARQSTRQPAGDLGLCQLGAAWPPSPVGGGGAPPPHFPKKNTFSSDGFDGMYNEGDSDGLDCY